DLAGPLLELAGRGARDRVLDLDEGVVEVGAAASHLPERGREFVRRALGVHAGTIGGSTAPGITAPSSSVRVRRAETRLPLASNRPSASSSTSRASWVLPARVRTSARSTR